MKQENPITEIIRSVRQDVVQRPLPEEGILCRRQSGRRRVLKGATISYCDYYAGLDCRISNLSDQGALLILSENNFCLETFTLTIPMDGIKVRCKLVEARGEQVRVVFCGEKIALPMQERRKQGMTDNPFLLPLTI